jgi:hypothetical protein
LGVDQVVTVTVRVPPPASPPATSPPVTSSPTKPGGSGGSGKPGSSGKPTHPVPSHSTGPSKPVKPSPTWTDREVKPSTQAAPPAPSTPAHTSGSAARPPSHGGGSTHPGGGATTKPPGVKPGPKAPPEVAPVLMIRTSTPRVFLKRHTKAVKIPVMVYTAPSWKKPIPLAWSHVKTKVAKVKVKGSKGTKMAGSVMVRPGKAVVLKIKALKKKGKDLITVRADNGKTLRIKVVAVKAKKAVVKAKIKGKKKRKMRVGQVKFFKAHALPKKATSAVVKWKSSKKKVARIDKAGRVAALHKGKTKITAKIGHKKVRIILKVKKPKK